METCFEVPKGIPGLKQAGLIAHKRPSKNLIAAAHELCPHATSLWKHKSLPFSFAMVADDFGVKHSSKQVSQKLIDTL